MPPLSKPRGRGRENPSNRNARHVGHAHARGEKWLLISLIKALMWTRADPLLFAVSTAIRDENHASAWPRTERIAHFCNQIRPRFHPPLLLYFPRLSLSLMNVSLRVSRSPLAVASRFVPLLLISRTSGYAIRNTRRRTWRHQADVRRGSPVSYLSGAATATMRGTVAAGRRRPRATSSWFSKIAGDVPNDALSAAQPRDPSPISVVRSSLASHRSHRGTECTA